MRKSPLKISYETEKSILSKLKYQDYLSDKEVSDLYQQLIDLGTMETAKSDYLTYVSLMWSVHAGGAPLSMHFGIEAIAEHVQAALERKIKRLMINIPPRNSKSSLTSISAPSWQWLHVPEEQFYYLSWGLNLCVQNMNKARLIFENYLYQPYTDKKSDKYIFSLVKNEEGTIFNNKGGHIISGSPGTGSLGRGYTVGLVDDLTEDNRASSLKAANDYFSERLMDRENNSTQTVKIIIMQRIDNYDLCGFVKEKYGHEDWVELVIPMEFDDRAKKYITNWKSAKIQEDPRALGEVLDKVRFPDWQITSLKADVATWETKFQQRPPEKSKLETTTLHKQYLVQTNEKPIGFQCIATGWDTAGTIEDTSSMTVAITVGLYNKKIYVFDMLRGHYDVIESLQKFERYATKYPFQKNVIENKNVGPTLTKYYKDAGIDIESANPGTYGAVSGKDQRFQTLVELFLKYKIVFLENSPFNKIKSEDTYILEDIYDELTNPLAEHDDIRDALFYAVAKVIMYENIVTTYKDNQIISTFEDMFVKDANGRFVEKKDVDLDTYLDYSSGYLNFANLREIEW